MTAVSPVECDRLWEWQGKSASNEDKYTVYLNT